MQQKSTSFAQTVQHDKIHTNTSQNVTRPWELQKQEYSYVRLPFWVHWPALPSAQSSQVISLWSTHNVKVH